MTGLSTTTVLLDDETGELAAASTTSFDDFSLIQSVQTPQRLVHWVDLVETPSVRAIRARRAGIARAIGAAAGSGTSLDEAVRQLSADTPDVHAHAQRVARTSAAISRVLGMHGRAADEVERAALLHDIGKLALPSSLLRKQALAEGDSPLARLHVMLGREMLEATADLRGIAAIAAAVHERWNGTGFPARLAGDAIPLAARIVAVANAHDEMTHPVDEAQALSADDANVDLVRRAGCAFDPDVVRAFLRVMENVSCF